MSGSGAASFCFGFDASLPASAGTLVGSVPPHAQIDAVAHTEIAQRNQNLRVARTARV